MNPAISKYAVISDVHGNRDALEAVLHDIDSQHIRHIFCLGDVVGYGPEPLEAVDLIRRSVDFCLMGNHDDFVCGNQEMNYGTLANISLEWTKEQFFPDYNKYNVFDFFRDSKKKKELRESGLEYLNSLSYAETMNNMIFVHGAPVGFNKFKYIKDKDDVRSVMKYNTESKHKIAFVGHTHNPFFSYRKDEKRISFEPVTENKDFTISNGYQHIINVGHVGISRSSDYRPCYAIYDNGLVSFRRVSYDPEITILKLKKKRGMIKLIQKELANRIRGGRK